MWITTNYNKDLTLIQTLQYLVQSGLHLSLPVLNSSFKGLKSNFHLVYFALQLFNSLSELGCLDVGEQCHLLTNIANLLANIGNLLTKLLTKVDDLLTNPTHLLTNVVGHMERPCFRIPTSPEPATFLHFL
jgi:hypothetical protein